VAIVGAFDIHRGQLTYKWTDTLTGEVSRGRICPADREHLRVWLGQFKRRRRVEFAMEGCTGWRYVAEEVTRIGAVAHVAEPADVAAPTASPRRAVRRTRPASTVQGRRVSLSTHWFWILSRGAGTAALVLSAFRAPYRGRSSPVNAWWGSFDLAVSLFSGAPAPPPSEDFIMRNAMDSQEVALGWWPGDPRFPRAAFYAYAHPAVEGFADASLEPDAARWDGALGEFVLDWNDVCASPDPHATALEFARSAFRHACRICDWDPALPASAEGDPPPVS